jgi:TolB-like protein
MRLDSIMATIYAFGPFRLDLEAEVLFRGKEPVALGRRAVALLRMLVERPGAPISKDALIEGAWSGQAVEDNNLTVQIGALRRVLGDAGGASWIETMPRRGYRFVGPAVAREQSAEAVGPPMAAALPDRLSIAVLPFANMSDDPEQEHFADGMTEDIITSLSKLHWLPVVARNSTFVYKGRPVSIKQVGAELGVRLVLEGSVRKSGDRMRVTGQLVESDTGEHLWAEHYDRQINRDLFAIQDQITRHVVTAIDSVVRAFEIRRTGHHPAGQSDGHKLVRTPAADAERRQLTVMRCELVRPTTRNRGPDLEDLRDAVGLYQRCIADVVGRFKGFPGHHVGNTVLVYFGYPATYEDDAEQAVRAGFELCAAVRNLGPRGEAAWECRVGIATGLVIVGDLVGGAEAQERGIIGETPNVAAQLQALAQPGTVAIDPTTRTLIGNLFDCRDFGVIEMAGAAEPAPAWQVLGASALESRFEALRLPALTSLVGRDEDLELLQRRWRQAALGEGRMVLISGEPGIGKSRLTAALLEHLQAEVHAHIRYFCSPHRQDSPPHPVISCLERIAGFAGDDPITLLDDGDVDPNRGLGTAPQGGSPPVTASPGATPDVLPKARDSAGDGRHAVRFPARSRSREALENGAQLEDVQKAAGHRDPGTTKLYDRRGYNPEKAASFFATY